MGIPFINTVGTPAAPQFAEYKLIEAVVDANGLSTIVVNVLHFKNTTPGVVCTESALMIAIKNALNTSLSAALSVASTGKKSELRFMDSPTFAFVVGSTYTAGAVTGDRLPMFNAVTHRLTTGVRGRSYKGSKHWAPIAESQTTLDDLNGGATTLWNAVATALASMGTAGLYPSGGSVWQLIVLSNLLSNLVSDPCVFTGALVSGVTTNPTIGTMLRRKEKPLITV